MAHRIMHLAGACVLGLVFFGCAAAAPGGAASTSQSDTSGPPRCRVLVAMSSATALTLRNALPPNDEISVDTGYFLVEMGTPVARMLDAGCTVTFATPDGAAPAMDPVSDSPSWFTTGAAESLAGLLDLPVSGAARAAYERARALADADPSTHGPGGIDQPLAFGDLVTRADDGRVTADVDALSSYSGVFIPAGYPPVVDLWNDANLGAILQYFHKACKPTGTLCHGAISLLSTRPSGDDGSPWIYRDYAMTVVSELEDRTSAFFAHDYGTYEIERFPEDELRAAGVALDERSLFDGPYPSHVVVDRELVTGQNPYSADEVGRAFVAMLQNGASCE